LFFLNAGLELGPTTHLVLFLSGRKEPPNDRLPFLAERNEALLAKTPACCRPCCPDRRESFAPCLFLRTVPNHRCSCAPRSRLSRSLRFSRILRTPTRAEAHVRRFDTRNHKVETLPLAPTARSLLRRRRLAGAAIISTKHACEAGITWRLLHTRMDLTNKSFLAPARSLAFEIADGCATDPRMDRVAGAPALSDRAYKES